MPVIDLTPKPLSLWLVERTDHVGLDEYDAFVVAAANENDARYVSPDEFHRTPGSWPTDPDTLRVTRIGTYELDGRPGTILGSFCAG